MGVDGPRGKCHRHGWPGEKSVGHQDEAPRATRWIKPIQSSKYSLDLSLCGESPSFATASVNRRPRRSTAGGEPWCLLRMSLPAAFLADQH